MADLACLIFNVGLGERSPPALQVAHTLPGQEAWACKPVLQLCAAHIEAAEGLLPYLLLPCTGMGIKAGC